MLKENYCPVSCLPAASKLLEKVICEQVSEYLESNKLPPDNQHGFRQKRSTMSAWADIQQDWATKTEAKEKTGVLLWDLSAAFDLVNRAGNNILLNRLSHLNNKIEKFWLNLNINSFKIKCKKLFRQS